MKFSLFCAAAAPQLLVRGAVERLSERAAYHAKDAGGRTVGEHLWPGAIEHGEAVEYILGKGMREVLAPGEAGRGRRLVAAGHRVVHGGSSHARPAKVTPELMHELKGLMALAPLHQPHNLIAIGEVARIAPELPQVACFDTAFHHTMPATARAYGLPRRFAEAGVRRYGFHGLSYEYIASVLPAVDGAAAEGRSVVAHLGNGASLCAMRGGKSVATTMGFSALDGLLMGTRCGSIDPGAVLYVQQRDGLDSAGMMKVLYEQSGLLGVSGVSADMRTLLASPEPHAQEAIDLFVYRAACEIGAMAAAMGGVDAVVFTGGIGEHAAPIRERICRACAWMGLELDAPANSLHRQRISAAGSRVRAWVIPADEEQMIARHTMDVIATAMN